MASTDKHRWGRLATGVVAAASMLILTACTDDAPTTTDDARVVFSVRIDPSFVVLDEMKTVRLRAVVTDRAGAPVDTNVEWSTDDASRATVGPDGTVSGVRGDLVTIRARADGREAWAHIQVEEIPHAIVFGSESLEVPQATSLVLDARVVCMAGHTVDRSIDWSVSDSSIALVSDDGMLTGMDPGEVIVTARSGGLVSTLSARITDPIVHIRLQIQDATIRIGQTVIAHARVIGAVSSSLDVPVEWTSSDPSVAEVAGDGIVSGRGRGTALITAAAGDRSASVLVTVRPGVTGIELSMPPAGVVVIGHPVQLEIETSLADDATGPVSLVWQSSDPAVATVDDNGVVRGVSAGAVTISASAHEMSSSVDLTVEPAASNVTVSPAIQSIPLGLRATLSAVASDATGATLHREFSWASSAPDIVGIDDAGGLIAWQVGSATITASTIDMSQGVVIRVDPYVASLSIEASADTLMIGETATLVAFARDGLGRASAEVAIWATSDANVVDVGAGGVAIARAEGDATITASAGGVSATVTLSVLPTGSHGPLQRIDVSPSTVHGDIGGSTQVSATGRDAHGNIVDVPFIWTSADPSIATVDQSGRVTGHAEGSTEIIVSSGSVYNRVPVTISQPGGGGGGGGEPEFGNNLSNPVVFADGIGVTGLPVATDPGLRPTADEGITVTGTSAFWYSGNRPDWQGTWYTQQSENTWRAQWLDGSANMQEANVDWGDNLISHTFNTHSPIRVEVVLYSANAGQMTGFNMTSLSGSGSTEVQGTDGTTALFTPTVYSVVPRLTIQKLDSLTMQPIPGAIGFDGCIASGLATEGPGSFRAEVNVAGKVIFGYNFFIPDISLPAPLHKYGWWRITFSLDATAQVGGTTVARNTRLVSLRDAGGVYTPVLDVSGTSTWIDIYVAQAPGGGGGGGGSGGAGGSGGGGGGGGGGCSGGGSHTTG